MNYVLLIKLELLPHRNIFLLYLGVSHRAGVAVVDHVLPDKLLAVLLLHLFDRYAELLL